jgi:hypothetical protein
MSDNSPFYVYTYNCDAIFAGFTAWSSQREPHQVFKLLETLYAEFDTLASQRGVFKVETVGDCYVAVCGLPSPNKKHSVVMARFAYDCYIKTTIVLRHLEVELGPDTAILGIRIGLNSGPVTAGVLRGERARFQLFGDVSSCKIYGMVRLRVFVSADLCGPIFSPLLVVYFILVTLLDCQHNSSNRVYRGEE